MSMDTIYEVLLSQFAELYEKQDILAKLTSQEFLHGYGYSEIHCIDAIGRMENPNAARIAKKLVMTRSAISKITKKLIRSGDIIGYQNSDNQKEICFKLTPKGYFLFKEHEQRHLAWEKRDREFLEKINPEILENVSTFLGDFNNYLHERIKAFK
ncbi:DNA-binding transcriptional regulator, MarR family [Propionispora vibrioides]|uniref:DNA-binding transcriptional regulator, MarR family n=2 Tax=Propionispora vibrioides TaxID=112903 RepID=A0A1H8W661_9FIRM|nr:DNA-binding transcriptional regulator, MarR family [Propionispora vibrioides]